MYRTASRRLWVLVVLAWLAQLCAPVAHAATMASMPTGMSGWCGTPSIAAAVAIAQLPDELRVALGGGDATTLAADHLSSCSQLCVAGSLAAPPLRISPTAALRLALLEAPAPAPQPAHVVRPSAAPPPAHGPPATR